MNSRQFLLGFLVFTALSANAADAPGVVQQQCARCHGPEGVASNAGTPHLNGQDEDYLGETLIKLQKGKQATQVAEHIPAALSAAQLGEIAAHYAKIRASRPQQETDPAKVALGESIYAKRCFDCHPDNGRDLANSAPLMAAQNLEYLIAQSKLYVSGKRKYAYLQDEAFKGLSERELEAVAHFFASQEQYVKAAGGVGKKKQRR